MPESFNLHECVISACVTCTQHFKVDYASVVPRFNENIDGQTDIYRTSNIICPCIPFGSSHRLKRNGKSPIMGRHRNCGNHNMWVSKSSGNLNFAREWLWVHRNTDKCLPTLPSWINVASGIEMNGWVYCWSTYFHCCVPVSLLFCDGWPERTACLYKVLF
jgi:hypothetical protein